ncbi:MAG: hypothetical protein HYT79_07870, partial [Elusimicrobia bacterium]|nr:hypothetical protein [Elusimicrobiota bacterium]
LGSTATLANPPITEVSTFSAVNVSSLAFQWQANSNPTGTVYIAEISNADTFPAALTFSSATLLTQASFSGLVSNTTYFARAKAKNHRDIKTIYAALGSTITKAGPPGASAFSDVTPTALRANWTANDNPSGNTLYITEIDDNAAFASIDQTKTTTALLADFTGLAVNATYYSRVKARNLDGTETSYTELGSTSTLANPPSTAVTTILSVFKTSMTAAWDANANPPWTVYRAQISTDAAFGAIWDSQTTLSHAVTFYNLTPLLFHHLRVKAVNNRNIKTAYTVLPGTSTLENIAPRAPAGLNGSWGKQFTLSWSPVVNNADGSATDDLSDYFIYRSTSSGGPFDFQIHVSSWINSWTDPNSIAYSAYYYKVQAIDFNHNTSELSNALLSAQDIKTEILASDGGMTLLIPSHLLTKEGSQLGEDIAVSLTRRNDQETGKALTSYEIVVTTPAGQKIEHYRFAGPVECVFKIPVQGSGLFQAAAEISPSDINNTGVFYFNGAEWIRLSSSINAQEKTAQTPTQRTGLYALRSTLGATEFTILGLEPRKIFTPAGAPPNNQLAIRFANPKDSQVSEARIYNLRGALVAQMSVSSDGTAYVWDGRDSEGNAAPGGVYLYQLKAEGKIFNGTVVLAR